MIKLNYQVLCENTLNELQKPLDSPRKTRKNINLERITTMDQRSPQRNTLVFNKRVLDPRTAITYPYGYRGLDSEDEDLIVTMVELLDEDDE